MNLDAYLRETGIKGSEFARRLDVSHSLVHGWRHGTKLPSMPMALKIAHATNGKVAALEDWLLPDGEARALVTEQNTS